MAGTSPQPCPDGQRTFGAADMLAQEMLANTLHAVAGESMDCLAHSRGGGQILTHASSGYSMHGLPLCFLGS